MVVFLPFYSRYNSFGDISDLCSVQFNKKKEIMYWLAINREPVSLLELQEDLLPPVPQLRLLEVLESLRRSLLEKVPPVFTTTCGDGI